MNKNSKTGTTGIMPEKTITQTKCQLETILKEKPQEGGTIAFLVGGELKKFKVATTKHHLNGLVDLVCSDGKHDHYELKLVVGLSTGTMKRIEREAYNRILAQIKEEQTATSS